MQCSHTKNVKDKPTSKTQANSVRPGNTDRVKRLTLVGGLVSGD